MRIGFDNDKYIALQAEHIRNRINQFGGKLYLEFGGKLFDDYHAARVLPGFEPDSKIRMLKSLADEVEIIIAINATTRTNPRPARSAAAWKAWASKATCTTLSPAIRTTSTASSAKRATARTNTWKRRAPSWW